MQASSSMALPWISVHSGSRVWNREPMYEDRGLPANLPFCPGGSASRCASYRQAVNACVKTLPSVRRVYSRERINYIAETRQETVLGEPTKSNFGDATWRVWVVV